MPRKYVKKSSKKMATKRPYKRRVYRRPNYKTYARRVIPSMEKKQLIYATDTNIPFGQVVGNNSGHYEVNVAPIPSVGSGQNNRIGRKISVTSLFFQFQFFQQAAALHPTMIRILLVQQVGKPVTTGIVGEFLQSNSFVVFANIYDYHSLRNQKTFKNYRVLINKVVKLDADSAPQNERMIKTIKIGRKFKYPLNIAFDDLAGIITNGNMSLILLADSGNASGLTTSTIPSGVPVLAINTGVLMNYNLTYYYVDA